MMTSAGGDNECEILHKEEEDAFVLRGVTVILNYSQTSNAGNIETISEYDHIQIFSLASEEWLAYIGLRVCSRDAESKRFQQIRDEEFNIRILYRTFRNRIQR